MIRSTKFTKDFEKKKDVPIDSKYSETHRNAKKNNKINTHVTQSPSGEAQPYLPHVTPRVLRSVHAKFHADWTKTVGARGIHLDKQPDNPSYFNYIDIPAKKKKKKKKKKTLTHYTLRT